jgi:Peptidase propeptide and YPEB domain
VTEEQAVARAEREIDFEPTRTQVRLLGQGINSKPYWIVSLSIPRSSDPDTKDFKELAVVSIDANSGEVRDVKIQR